MFCKQGKESQAPPGWPIRHSWSNYSGTVEVEARFVLPKGTTFEPAKVELQIPTEFETVELPFRIRDIPLH